MGRFLDNNKPDAAVGEDPRKEGYPTFCEWGGEGNQNWHVKLYDSFFQPIGSPWASAANSTTSYRFGMLADPTFGYSSIDYANANDQLSSQSYSSWNCWQQALHQNDQYPVSMFGSVSALGMQTFHSLNNTENLKLIRGKYLINQVMPEGMRPRRFFGMNNNSFIEYSGLTQMNTYKDFVNLSTYKITRTINEGYGSAGYNERTKTLVTLHGNNDRTVIATVFKSSINLNTCTNLTEFFANATVKEYSITIQTSGSDCRYDKVVVVGDNDWVGISYKESNNQYADVVDLSGKNNTTIALGSISNTTSYGTSQADPYYTKMNNTWDNNWAAAYTPYYYYGCGLSAYIFSTKDPRRNFRIQNTNTNGGGAMLPIGKSGFVYLNGENTDGAAVNMVSWDFAQTDHTEYTSNTVYVHSNISTSDTSLPAIANGSFLNASANRRSGMTGHSYTTCYPRFMAVNFWSLNGKNSYEGGFNK